MSLMVDGGMDVEKMLRGSRRRHRIADSNSRSCYRAARSCHLKLLKRLRGLSSHPGQGNCRFSHSDLSLHATSSGKATITSSIVASAD
jgi:hypothetical protein